MIGEDIIFPLTISPGDVHPLFQLPLPTIHTRTPEDSRLTEPSVPRGRAVTPQRTSRTDQ